jgi:signal transduction histidine kinase
MPWHIIRSSVAVMRLGSAGRPQDQVAPPEAATMRLLSCLALVLFLAFPAARADACAADQKRVLLLDSFSPRADFGFSAGAAEQFVQTLRDALNGCLDDYHEYFEAARFDESEYLDTVADFLARKYAGLRFDLIVTFQRPALSFVVRHGRELFPGTPVFFVAGKGTEAANSSPDPGFAGAMYKVDLRPTVMVMRSLQPALKCIYVISGGSAFDRNYEQRARDQFREFEGRFEFVYLTGLPIAALRAQVARLPADSAVFLMMITSDRDGTKFARDDVARMITAASSVPVYTSFSSHLDHGIVGGNLVSLDEVLRQAAPLIVRILQGESAASVGVSEVYPNVLAFDSRQLRRWGIPESRLPSGSSVLFREPGIWEQHRSAAMTALAIVAAQAALIVGLVLQRNRRRQAETRARNLAGRLLNAQETERRRIARDLHDDLSQSMAVVSFELSNLMAKPGALEDAEVSKALASIERRSDEISKTLRTLSHNLHPPVLQHIGLAAALTSYCRDLQAHGVMTVSCQVANRLEPISKEVALCLYRIAQEALQNAWKHSHARRVHVSLARHGTTLELTVADDGRGFDLSAARENVRGLGLVSIEERTRLVNGTVSIRTSPGDGVFVQVLVPMAEDASHDAATLIPRVSSRPGETG